MALGAKHIEPANTAHFVALDLARSRELNQQFGVTLLRCYSSLAIFIRHLFERHCQSKFVNQRVWIKTFLQNFGACKSFWVSAEHDVDTAASHVGCNSDASQAAGLRND